ncbi:MAG: flavodoxin-dependent (E)-4-hydroxy-3-methylbut-2-enyl-diphosphate synthase, partial [Bacteroidales bacterium]|nr:flavodoxin-dependent (E)-4-hydroxy-3-methylbut-2-enyl-diphosphate synthase [Bacteroidales bacterium]
VIAEEAARVVEKVRINPGNYIDKRASFKEIKFSEIEYKLELEKIHERILPLIKICKENGTAIRIGSNHGSLSDRILTRYGNTPEGMVESALEFADIFIAENFYNLVMSMKASDTRIMTYACRLLNARMLENAMVFPQHLGVTEAGADIDGRLKSAVGIGALLSDGIGDTLRVSLTENPENEIIFEKKLLSSFKNRIFKYQVVSQAKNTYNPYAFEQKLKQIPITNQKTIIVSDNPDSDADIVFYDGNTIDNINPNKAGIADFKLIKAAGKPSNLYPIISFSEIAKQKFLTENYTFITLNTFDIQKDVVKDIFAKPNIIPVLEFSTENPLGELRYFYKELKKINKNLPILLKYQCNSIDEDDLISEIGIFPGAGLIDGLANGVWLNIPNKNTDEVQLQLDLLQAIGLRYTKAEFISCPGCGRTNYDLQKLTKAVKKEFSHLKGYKIAVMGCVVNGPGEMADADFGCVGAAKNKVHIYKGKTAVVKNIPQENAVEELKKVIEESLWEDEENER